MSRMLPVSLKSDCEDELKVTVGTDATKLAGTESCLTRACIIHYELLHGSLILIPGRPIPIPDIESAMMRKERG